MRHALVCLALTIGASTVAGCGARNTGGGLPGSTESSPSRVTGTTAPSEDGRRSVFVIGDFGDGGDDELAVADAMEHYSTTHEISALLTTGDNFYIDDVAIAWSRPFGWVDDHAVPVFAAWGNHDVESARRESLVQDVLDPPGRWYETSIGPARLLVLDSNEVEDPGQTAWVEKALAQDTEGPLIVSFHHPAFSCSRHGSTEDVIDRWVPLFEASGVDLVLNGHDHLYQRLEQNGVTYVVTGGGGGRLYRRESCPARTPEPVVTYDEDFHFLVLEIGDDVNLVARTPSGAIIDRAVIGNRP